MHTAATGSAHDNGYTGAPTVTAFRREISNLIKSAGNEIGKLHFSYGTHPHQCRANGSAHNSRLRNRRIDDAPLTEFFEHAGGDFEGASVDAYVFTQDEDAL